MHAVALGKPRELAGRPNNRGHKIPNIRWLAPYRVPGHAEEHTVPCIHREPMISGHPRRQYWIPRIEKMWDIVRITDSLHQIGHPIIKNLACNRRLATIGPSFDRRDPSNGHSHFFTQVSIWFRIVKSDP